MKKKTQPGMMTSQYLWSLTQHWPAAVLTITYHLTSNPDDQLCDLTDCEKTQCACEDHCLLWDRKIVNNLTSDHIFHNWNTYHLVKALFCFFLLINNLKIKYKLTGRFNLQSFTIKGSSIHFIYCISGSMIVIKLLQCLTSNDNLQ